MPTPKKQISVEPTEQTRHIAIVTHRDFYYNYGDDCDTVVASITDWTEVSEEDYKLLSRYCGTLNNDGKYNYSIIERKDKQSGFLAKTIEQFKQLAAAEEKAAAERAAAEEQRKKEAAARKAAAKAKRELAKRAETEAAERALLEELEKKYKGKK